MGQILPALTHNLLASSPTRSPKTGILKTGLSFPFRILQPMKAEFRLPIGNNKAGFSPIIIGYSRFYARKPVIGKYVFKNASLRPVGFNRPKREYARIKS
jgi:hypothetical protein